VLRAAAILRGESVPAVGKRSETEASNEGKDVDQQVFPKIVSIDPRPPLQTVGYGEIKVDAIKLVQGKPAFTADFPKRDMLVAKVLRSPHAHAEIKHIDTSKAKALPGVVAVLTWQDIPRVVYSTAGQSHPIPGPLDAFSLDHKVRFVGDRVAFLAAETAEIAEEALSLIEVEYEVLPPVLDATKAMDSDAPIIHDEPEYVNFADSNASLNLAAKIRIDIGDVDKGFKEADQIFIEDFEVQKQHQAYIEPHVATSYWDEDDRLVITTSTQVPFHVRRILAPVLGLPVKRMRVIKPRIGGGFGGKQEVLIEDVAAHLTIATGRPVIYMMTLEEEFLAARPRHPMHMRMKTGVKNDGTITANEMYCLSDTGAYGCHALTVAGNTGHKAMALYVGDGKFREHPNIRFYADAVYTNTVPSGAYRGYGVPQGFWAIERHLETIIKTLDLDPLEFRLKNALRPGELHPFSTAWSEGREPKPETIVTNGLVECVQQGRQAIGWDEKYNNPDWHAVPGKEYLRKGIGIAMLMQGTSIPNLDMGGASIKINDDGSFNLLVGATDLGTGSDTVLGQMAAETLGVPLEDIIVYSSDTDFTPFDKGAYASSTTYISGAATTKAAEIVAEKIRKRASRMFQEKGFDVDPEAITLKDRKAFAPSGEYITIKEIALDAIHKTDQEQIMAVASHVSPVSPPPFAAQFAEVTVDTETGMVTVDKLVMAVDSGMIINPVTAAGQVEGGMAQALGYAVSEEMVVDDEGQPREKNFVDYHIFRANEMPEMETIFVETHEPSHPFGVKSVSEIPMDGVAPAVGNAILDACGAYLTKIPAVPENVWRSLHNHAVQEED
jgi:putative selenate reductase molybdopterin-binding subunit